MIENDSNVINKKYRDSVIFRLKHLLKIDNCYTCNRDE